MNHYKNACYLYLLGSLGFVYTTLYDTIQSPKNHLHWINFFNSVLFTFGSYIFLIGSKDERKLQQNKENIYEIKGVNNEITDELCDEIRKSKSLQIIENPECIEVEKNIIIDISKNNII